ncbi:MAG: PspC domain-containing protein [Candidatus Hydrogenedentes bacterium]|nr:PspC domain-containing protein [Candidatus Hydrogenedentota bacterium]
MSRNDNTALLNWDNRIWLGVCAGLAHRFGVEPVLVRFAAVMLGIVPFLLPFLLVGYLAVYFYVYFTAEGNRSLDEINWISVAKSAAVVFAIALLLHVVSGLLATLLAHGVMLLTQGPPTIAPKWGWLVTSGGSLFRWTLFIAIPLAMLAGLPLASGWQGTMKKVVHAGLAVYGVILCFGLASLIVGTLLGFIDDTSGKPGTDALLSLMR